jgi:hypothetical protein
MNRPDPGELAKMVREYFEERAAILEFSAGFPRWQAEKMAAIEAAKYKRDLWKRGWK